MSRLPLLALPGLLLDETLWQHQAAAFASSHPVTSFPLTPEATIAEAFSARASRSPNAIAYREFDSKQQAWRDYSWRDMADSIARMRAAFRNEGLKAGERAAALNEPRTATSRSTRIRRTSSIRESYTTPCKRSFELMTGNHQHEPHVLHYNTVSGDNHGRSFEPRPYSRDPRRPWL